MLFVMPEDKNGVLNVINLGQIRGVCATPHGTKDKVTDWRIVIAFTGQPTELTIAGLTEQQAKDAVQAMATAANESDKGKGNGAGRRGSR